MRLPLFVVERLFAALKARVAMRRTPDVVIGDNYLRRWWVIPRNRLFNLYLHEIRRSDDDRALHDHPWINCSILLSGYYVEHQIAAGGINIRTLRRAGDLVFRSPRSAHRLEMAGDACWTLFVTGPNVRSWGFHCPRGWVHWRDFTKTDDPTQIGRGCGEPDA